MEQSLVVVSRAEEHTVAACPIPLLKDWKPLPKKPSHEVLRELIGATGACAVVDPPSPPFQQDADDFVGSADAVKALFTLPRADGSARVECLALHRVG